MSGLTAAFQLRRLAEAAGAPVDVRVLEAAERHGGKVLSVEDSGFLVEGGPNGFLDSRQPVLDLVEHLGLTDRLVRADEASAKRFVWHRGELHPVPSSPGAMIKSRLLSWRGKLRLVGERFAGGPPPPGDETVAEFGRRRIGAEATARLLDPFVTGIYAGDIETTSMAAAFPRMVALEREHGSLMRALGRLRRERRRAGVAQGTGPAGPGGTLTSFPGGMREMTDALAAALGAGAVIRGARVGTVERGADDAAPYRVRLESGEELEADAVVSAAPAHAASGFLGGLGNTGLVDALRAIPYAPAAVVGLGYRRADMPHPVDGFGFLVPKADAGNVLGMTWDHAMFPGRRAPEGHVLLRSVVGGARSPELVALDDQALVGAVREEVARVAGAQAPPRLARVVRWERAIPQYVVGHLGRVEAVEAACAALPGLFVGGNALRGVSLADCAADALRIAEAVLDALQAPTGS
jgi:oxygen-dependent protoporphyrinogen oxidase